MSLSSFEWTRHLGSIKFVILVLIGPPALLLTGHLVLGIITMALLVGTGAAVWLVRAGRLRSLTEIQIPTWLGYTFAAAVTFVLCAAIIYFTRTP